MTMSFCDSSGSGNIFIGGNNFKDLHKKLADSLLDTEPFNAGKWQAVDISGSSAHDTYELLNTTIWLDIPEFNYETVKMVDPDLPWAEGHFQERVAGLPVNPGDWHDKWPYHSNGKGIHQKPDQKYDHNYMERFWARKVLREVKVPSGKIAHYETFKGYRFDVGDLGDVVRLLQDEPGTRQAFLPVWFPEDTGASQGQRVPCTLGYQFIIRQDQLHVVYFLRSCEVYRHFKNDVYMAMRLGQWVRDSLTEKNSDLKMGTLTMQITSLHGFVGDLPHIERIANGSD